MQKRHFNVNERETMRHWLSELPIHRRVNKAASDFPCLKLKKMKTMNNPARRRRGQPAKLTFSRSGLPYFFYTF